MSLSTLYFFGLIISTILVAVWYHKYQNNGGHIGGKISSAKSFWLSYALFYYFVLPIFLYFLLEHHAYRFVINYVLYLLYARLIIQGFAMLVTRNWIPRYGIIFNIIGVLMVLTLAVIILINDQPKDDFGIVLISYFLFQLFLILITDTVYAIKFNQIAGSQTKGSNAVWYASDDDEFEKINRLTKRNNYFFICLAAIMIILILMYDKY